MEVGAQPWAKFDVYGEQGEPGYLIHVHFTGTAPTQEEFTQDVLAPLQEVLDAGKPFTLLVDTCTLATVPWSVGFDVVKFMRLNQPKFRAHCQASAIVVGNAFIRGLLEWVFTLSPPVSPNVVTDNAPEGLAFVNSHKPTA